MIPIGADIYYNGAEQSRSGKNGKIAFRVPVHQFANEGLVWDLGVVINNSCGIIFAHQKEPFRSRYGEQHWEKAVEAATKQMIEELYLSI